jgi:hypothetical protein
MVSFSIFVMMIDEICRFCLISFIGTICEFVPKCGDLSSIIYFYIFAQTVGLLIGGIVTFISLLVVAATNLSRAAVNNSDDVGDIIMPSAESSTNNNSSLSSSLSLFSDYYYLL